MQVAMNVARFLNRAAALYGNKPAVFDDDRVFTYRQLWQRVQRLSRALLDLGVRPGDRVAWLGYNNHPLLEAYFGVVQFGAILVPLNIRLTPSDLAGIIDDAQPQVLVFDSDFEPAARQIAQGRPITLVEIQIAGAHTGYLDYEAFLAGASSEESAMLHDLDENAPAELFYTSGTTGRPKGVALTHRNLYMNAMNVMATENMSDQTVMLHTIPLFHVNGWGSPHYITALGATHVMLRKFVPRTVFELIERHRVTQALLVPTMVRALNLAPERKQYDLSSLIRVTIGGAPSPSSFVAETMEALAVEYQGGYGLSETSPVVSSAAIKGTLADGDTEALYRWRGTAGIPLIGVEVSLVDDQDRELPWDGQTRGELRVRADTVMAGYWQKPEETTRVMKNGWFYTGDMALIDAEGYIRIVDRKKDIIISGGENISSVELEDALYNHPAVAEASVIGKPDPVWGEIPFAVVSLKPGAHAEAEEILAGANASLAGFKRIKGIAVVPELPKTGTGKIQKNRVREQFGGALPQ
ncbi:long-chain-fatty-acid--CoA ligase [Sulfobacillus harzensis]|uniref:Long-chain-fatty-acid--CoA ligase n=1 Tax=Sulfobacillus harzensis TaxID=2729629 RepID=A0A7Y0L7E5_9FIRM|nr:long-chain-fatty-acid--CoA ligase [Sulfobacillus harzensis]NMP23304.1 long-chain-fatty-acid--CoA ligase [Sulfobacillus harzensis]